MCAATGVATLARPIANTAIAQARAERCMGCIPRCKSMGGWVRVGPSARRQAVDPIRRGARRRAVAVRWTRDEGASDGRDTPGGFRLPNEDAGGGVRPGAAGAER